jgi:glycosyltransferase involved in cell wall biosynthesis
LGLKILITSERFYPSIGGIETVTRLLAESLHGAGHRVSVLTNEPGHQASQGFYVARRPPPSVLLSEYRQAEAVILQGPTLRLGWPLLFIKKRTVMVHHTTYPRDPDTLRRSLRAGLRRRARHAAVSGALAKDLGSWVIRVLPNPYDAKIFHQDTTTARTRDFLFVGRLIPEKGAHILLQALARLKRSRIPFSGTIVGEGPEREHLSNLIAAERLGNHVAFLGRLSGAALAQVYRQHKVLAVPSQGMEAFGLVALEGAACGCRVAASNCGGLSESVGDSGVMVPTMNIKCWSQVLYQLLVSSEKARGGTRPKSNHFSKHHPDFVARAYLEFVAQ